MQTIVKFFGLAFAICVASGPISEAFASAKKAKSRLPREDDNNTRGVWFWRHIWPHFSAIGRAHGQIHYPESQTSWCSTCPVQVV